MWNLARGLESTFNEHCFGPLHHEAPVGERVFIALTTWYFNPANILVC